MAEDYSYSPASVPPTEEGYEPSHLVEKAPGIPEFAALEAEFGHQIGSHIVYGALHGQGLYHKERLTKSEVVAAIRAHLNQPLWKDS